MDESGKRTAVVLSVKDYELLLEDLHDLGVVAERRPEPAMSLAEIKTKLRADGLLSD